MPYGDVLIASDPADVQQFYCAIWIWMSMQVSNQQCSTFRDLMAESLQAFELLEELR